MTIKKLTESEFYTVEELALRMTRTTFIGSGGSNIEDFFSDKDVTISDMDGVLVDIQYDELFQAIKRFKVSETYVVAVDSDGVGFNLIEILHNDYDNVFGFIETKEGKEFHYCEAKTSYNEELERDETIFFVDDEPVILEDCIRTNNPVWGGI